MSACGRDNGEEKNGSERKRRVIGNADFRVYLAVSAVCKLKKRGHSPRFGHIRRAKPAENARFHTLLKMEPIYKEV